MVAGSNGSCSSATPRGPNDSFLKIDVTFSGMEADLKDKLHVFVTKPTGEVEATQHLVEPSGPGYSEGARRLGVAFPRLALWKEATPLFPAETQD